MFQMAGMKKGGLPLECTPTNFSIKFIYSEKATNF
jgi:hypothetical protein